MQIPKKPDPIITQSSNLGDLGMFRTHIRIRARVICCVAFAVICVVSIVTWPTWRADAADGYDYSNTCDAKTVAWPDLQVALTIPC